MKHYFYLLFILLIFSINFTGCNNKKNRSRGAKTEVRDTVLNQKELPKQPKIGKAIFYLENSGSMFGYVNDFTEYVDVVSELSSKPRFVEESTPREFYFVNGGENIVITKIGKDPTVLKNKLNIKGFNCGDVSKSNLNSMFQLALSQAKNDTISILISDAIYDIGKPQIPINALAIEGKTTRSQFIERLNKGDLQTIIIKLTSDFKGKYFPVSGGSIYLTQKRPFYIWIFGKAELLNDYFPDKYINSLKGYSDMARFLKSSNLEIPYQVTTYKKTGSFEFDKNNKTDLIKVKNDRNSQGFQFTFAVDYSNLPFSESYLTTSLNYICNNSNFSIKNISSIGDVKLFGLTFNPTHLITVGTDGNPYGQLEVSLQNNVPNWIENTNINDENNIKGDTTHTFGFKFLTDAISDAYQYKSKEKNAATFKFELKK